MRQRGKARIAYCKLSRRRNYTRRNDDLSPRRVSTEEDRRAIREEQQRAERNGTRHVLQARNETSRLRDLMKNETYPPRACLIRMGAARFRNFVIFCAEKLRRIPNLA